MIELRHLRYFVAVAEELHFGRAARRLNVSQPPLSHQIRQLEAALGATLFARTHRRVELTPAGTALLEGARRTLAEATRSIAAVQRASRGEVDVLRVAFTDSAALGGLPEIVRAFQAAHPHVHLELTEGTSQAQVEAVERDDADVALVRGPVTSTQARAEVVRREPFLVALPAGHRLVARRTVTLAALRSEAFLLFPRALAPAFYDLLTELCRGAGFEPLVRHESAEYQTMLSLIAAGLGITIVPASVRNLRRVGVEFRPLKGVQATAELAVVYRPHRLSRPLSAFIAIASATARGRGGLP
jgi:LysR family transcriptional regulator, benzoate and cis,cis-muconate-responsive activator of ben and cat genes